ncbi:zinc finger protein 420-like isoform X2 [Maniola hyperantus]|uniref:zinc finger protein 420-like isoform X2 n=1 Tax=Aphantopus hyperantus TaxID=2795564 RepID=UPI0037498606
MRCCVPFCNNTADNVTTTDGNGISFHGFPREGSLRAAWLRALGKQGSQLPDSAVVCSRHFLDDDICEAESGFRQLVAGAIPSTVQVCMICLDTDSKLCLMSKHNLEGAYEQLTGHTLCNEFLHLKQTLCVQCAQRLRNFSRFRDKSLRARALMMDLVDKHELLTIQHIQMIDRTKHQLKSNIVWTVLGPDPCELYIPEHPSEDRQTELEETVDNIVVKIEARDDSVLDTEVTNDDDNKVYGGFGASNEECLSNENMKLQTQLLNEALCKALKGKAPAAEQVAETQDPIKYESAPIQCILCTEEFLHVHAYVQHMHLHLQNGAGEEASAASQVAQRSVPSLSALSTNDKLSIWKQNVESCPSADLPQTVAASLPARLATNNANKVHATEEANNTIGESERGPETNYGEVAVSNNRAHINLDRLTNCVVKLYDCKKFKVVPRQDASHTKTRKAVSSYENQNIDNASTISKEYRAISYNVVPSTENIKPVTNEVRVKSEPGCSTNSIDVQLNNAAENNSNTFPEKKSFTCDICQKMFKRKSLLIKHIQAHNKIKPYACAFCKFKTAHKGNLRYHVKIHTGEKPFACEICNYRSTTNSHIVRHMQTHTGEKRYACSSCNYKCARNSHLVRHMRTHSKGTPYSCNLCEYECKQNSSLVKHMRTHTRGKLYSCSLCKYKCSTDTRLENHMRIHTGEKPYSCSVCKYKCSTGTGLVVHMRIHTGEKPFSCSACEYKCSTNNRLVEHIRIHTGEKPYSCNSCEYKCSTHTRLLVHMRTHTGEKPHSCKLCDYKFVDRGGLMRHMKTHTGEKPHACTLCDYRCSRNSDVVKHMRIHSQEKPYLCSLCAYTCTHSSYLVNHMKIHTGHKPYACTICNYKCTRNDYLIVHMRTHTGEKPYSCKLCNHKFRDKGGLVRHMKIYNHFS